MEVYDGEFINELETIAKRVRLHSIKMIYHAGSGHPGGSLSCADILTALYFHVMKHDPKRLDWSDRDRFVLSKGHAAPALYAVLAEAGYFSVDELSSLRKMGSRLQGHPCMHKTPGVEMSTGSLGHGLAAGNGMALAAKLDRKLYRMYVVVGDGEMDVGETWEAAMLASHYKLDNITVYLDRNKLQLDGPTETIMSLEPLSDKWKAFGWHVIEINGHNMKEIIHATNEAKAVKGKPTIIICHTIKGKGVSYMEGSLQFHGKAPNKQEYEQALKELGGEKA
ncbi:MAG: transketolase [Thermoplasmatota archaeon]|nr:transketolase [Candidatus Thermoplasmatota archaeon]MBU1914027.1 transketolase [Candidatus Thermoplasmatota archaeon]